MWNLLRCRRMLSAVGMLGAIAVLAGCDKSPTSPSPTPTPAPPPVSVSNVSPSPLIRSGSGQLVTITGLGFQSGLTLTVIDPGGGSVGIASAFVLNVSPTSFQVSVTLATAGKYGVVVQQGSETSSQFSFNVFEPPPQIDSVSPALTIVDSEPQPVALLGSRFDASMTLRIVEPDGAITTSGFTLDGDSLIQFRFVFSKTGTYLFSVSRAGALSSNAIDVRVG